MSDDDTKYTATGAPVDERFSNPPPPGATDEAQAATQPTSEGAAAPDAVHAAREKHPPKAKAAKARSKQHATRKSRHW